MRPWVTMAAGALALGLGGCVSYHQVAAPQRMSRPKDDLDTRSAGSVASDPAYPSVGGDILKGVPVHTDAPELIATPIVASPAAPPAAPVGPIRRRVTHHFLVPADAPKPH
jgi:hypothetical protein